MHKGNLANGLSSIPSATGGIARLACDRLREAGINLAPVISGAGLTTEDIQDHKRRLDASAQVKICRRSSEAEDLFFERPGKPLLENWPPKPTPTTTPAPGLPTDTDNTVTTTPSIAPSSIARPGGALEAISDEDGGDEAEINKVLNDPHACPPMTETTLISTRVVNPVRNTTLRSKNTNWQKYEKWQQCYANVSSCQTRNDKLNMKILQYKNRHWKCHRG